MKRASKVSPPKKTNWIVLHLTVLVFLSVAVYWPSLHGEFVFDDQQVILQNPDLMNIRSLGDVFSLGMTWRQLLYFTYGFNYYLGGVDTFTYHILNVAFHAINTLLVFFVILAAAGEEPRREFAAFAGAAIFAVHTMLTGAVSYVTGRSSVLCATFYFLAVLLFLRSLSTETRNMRILQLSLAGVAGFLAWQTKQEAITLPFFLAAVLFLKSEKKDWRVVAALAAIPFIVLIFIRSEIINLYSEVMNNRQQTIAGFEAVLSPANYFRTYVTSVVGYYFPRFVFPTGLSIDPQIAVASHWYSLEFLFAVVVLGGIVWAFFRTRKQPPLLAVGLAALMVSPLTAYVAMPMSDIVQEHRAYIPGLGIALLFAAVFLWTARKMPAASWPALAIVVLVFSSMTISRNTVWATNIGVWTDAEAKGPQKPRTHFNLGQTYHVRGRLDEAIREYEHALALKPDLYAAYANIGAIYLDRGNLPKGEEMLLKVTQLAPEMGEGFVNLGVLYMRQQQTDKALEVLDRAIELNPNAFAAYFNKGEALTLKKDFKAATQNYEKAISIRPDIPSFHLSLGIARSQMGDHEGAEKEFTSLLDGPLAAQGYRSLGVIYNHAREPNKAVEFLKQAVRIRPDYAEAHHDLAIIYLNQKKTDDAIEHLKSTLAQQPSYGPGVMNLALAYQMKGDVGDAKQVLEDYLRRFGNTPEASQIQQRLAALK